MRKFLFALTLTIISAVGSAQTIAKSDASNPWRERLESNLAKRFQLSADTAKIIVRIKEGIFSQLMPLDLPHVETQMGKEGKADAILAIRTREFNQVQAVLNNESKSKEVISFLEGKIPIDRNYGRKR